MLPVFSAALHKGLILCGKFFLHLYTVAQSVLNADKVTLTPFSDGETVVTNNPEITVAEEQTNLMVVPEGVTISDLVKALNAIGVTPRDLISILQAIKAAGASSYP